MNIKTEEQARRPTKACTASPKYPLIRQITKLNIPATIIIAEANM